jgi:hypothetical protein
MTALVLVLPKFCRKPMPSLPEKVAAGRCGADHSGCGDRLPIVSFSASWCAVWQACFGIANRSFDSHILAVGVRKSPGADLGHQEGAVVRKKTRSYLGALDLSDRAVEESCCTACNIEMIDAALPVRSLEQMSRKAIRARQRYRGDPENIVGDARQSTPRGCAGTRPVISDKKCCYLQCHGRGGGIFSLKPRSDDQMRCLCAAAPILRWWSMNMALLQAWQPFE